MTKIFWKTDEHVPEHDPKAIELGYKICEDFDPDIVPAGSDGMDHYSLSSFDKDPARMHDANLQKEIDVWKSVERGWSDAAPNAKRVWIPGNHEQRRHKMLIKQAPSLSYLRALQPEVLYGLDELGIEYRDHEFVVDDIVFTHGKLVRKFSAYTAKAVMEGIGFGMNAASGHTHRMGAYYHTSRNGTYWSVEGGCLCKLTPEYMNNPNWQQGVTLVWTKPSTFVQIPFIRKGRKLFARWNDKEYSA